ncbi:MAG: hypothetical protein QOK21_2951 [Solirubrobacteraceae bacterium]|jgi:hypothetical protein|nr:hypothetical protein [Solirubrobacteraceae bacterium]
MSESEVRGTATFYDHELEDGHPTGRRRRAAADWGVGEELFDHMPSRRRFRAGEAPARQDAPRRDAHLRERAAQPRPPADFDRPTDELEVAAPTPASVVDAAWMAELAERAMPTPVRAEVAGEDDAHAAIDTVARPAEGRRTVVIRGRGAEPARAARRDRRPARTVGERLGPRPDRVAAWSVALGVLLILIAILTAH